MNSTGNLFVTAVDASSKKDLEKILKQNSEKRILSAMGVSPTAIPRARRKTEGMEPQKRKFAEKRRLTEIFEAKKFAQQQKVKRQKAQDWIKKQKQIQHDGEKFKKLHDKITLKPPTADYYTNSPIAPGFEFFKWLFTSQKVPCSKLDLRIPPMLYIDESITFAQYVQGGISVTKPYYPMQFYLDQELQKVSDEQTPALLRIPSSNDPTGFKASPLSWQEFRTMAVSNKFPQQGIVQKYIKCHADRPCITRIFYRPNNRSNKASSAMVIANTKICLSKYSFGNQILITNYADSFEIFHQKSSAFAALEEQSYKIVQFLQTAYYVKIEEISFDFIQDKTRSWWFLGCKGFRLDKNILLARERRITEKQEFPPEELDKIKQDKKERSLCPYHCKLCLLSFKNNELANSIPFKMLMMYKQHTYLTGRSVLDLSHLKCLSPAFLTHTVRTCPTCYMIILQEHELIHAEHSLARQLNIPVKPVNVMAELKYSHPNFMPDRCDQWRVMFFFQTLKLNKSILKENRYPLQYEFLEQKFNHECRPKWNRKDEAFLNFPRLFYIFAENNEVIRNFLQPMELSFQIGWLSGQTRPFKSFSCAYDEKFGVCQSNDITLFNGHKQKAILRVTFWIAKDQSVDVRNLPVSIRRVGTVFIPEETYINADLLPDPWIELFDSDIGAPIKTPCNESSVELEESYAPKLADNQMVAQPFGNQHVLHTNYSLNPMSFRQNSMQLDRSLSKISKFGDVSHLNTQRSLSAQRAATARRQEQSQRSATPSPMQTDRPLTSAAASKRKMQRVQSKREVNSSMSVAYSRTTGLTSPTFISSRIGGTIDVDSKKPLSPRGTLGGGHEDFLFTSADYFLQRNIMLSTRSVKTGQDSQEPTRHQTPSIPKLKLQPTGPSYPELLQRPTVLIGSSSSRLLGSSTSRESNRRLL